MKRHDVVYNGPPPRARPGHGAFIGETLAQATQKLIDLGYRPGELPDSPWIKIHLQAPIVALSRCGNLIAHSSDLEAKMANPRARVPKDGYQITHNPSGWRVVGKLSLEESKRVLRAIEGLVDWSQSSDVLGALPSKVKDEILSAIKLAKDGPTKSDSLERIIDVILEALYVGSSGGVPSGHLYMALSHGGITLDTYQQLLAVMEARGLVTVEHHLVRLVGGAS